MKVFYLTAIACITGNVLFAQTIPTPGSRYKDIFFKKLSATVPIKANLLSTQVGNKVYALPLDKTLCFVPDVNTITAIPNATIAFQNSNMPNALKKEEIIP